MGRTRSTDEQIIGTFAEYEALAKCAEDSIKPAHGRVRVTCHGIFAPPAMRVRPDQRTEHEANEIQRRADHWHFDGA